MANINDLTMIRPGQLNPDLTTKSGTPVARPSNIVDNPMATYSKALSNALGPDVFEGVNVFRGVVLLSSAVPDAESDTGSPAESRQASVMIPELHYEKINPFLANNLQEFINIARKFYPVFPIMQSAENVSKTIGTGMEVLVTFRDANKSVGEITFIDKTTEPISPFNDAVFTEAGRQSARSALNNFGNGQVQSPSQALVKASRDLGVSEEFLQQKLQDLVPGSRFTSPFGPRTPPYLGNGKYGSANHRGIDLAPTPPGKIGDPVNSLLGGEVIDVVTNQGDAKEGYGNLVRVMHDDGTVSLYAHLDSVSVVPGDKIEPGDPLGGLGNSGGSTGAHLHFEIKTGANDDGTGGTHIDPIVWFANQDPNSNVSYE